MKVSDLCLSYLVGTKKMTYGICEEPVQKHYLREYTCKKDIYIYMYIIYWNKKSLTTQNPIGIIFTIKVSALKTD